LQAAEVSAACFAFPTPPERRTGSYLLIPSLRSLHLANKNGGQSFLEKKKEERIAFSGNVHLLEKSFYIKVCL
jgi:hypothetical protein